MMQKDGLYGASSLLLALSLLISLARPTIAAGTGFWITGIEAVQAVQTPTSGVPLIGGKPTFVRVYVRSNQKNHGPWTGISATLTVKAKNFSRTHKPISPRPDGAITVSPFGSHRDRWSDSFTFALDADECAPDQKLFVIAKVFSIRGEADGSSPGSHEKAAALNFSPAINLSVYAFAWQAEVQDDPIGGGAFNTRSLDPIKWEDFAVHEEYLRAVYPVSHFAFVPIPSIGTATYKCCDEAGIRNIADLYLATLPVDSLIFFLKAWDTGGQHGYAVGQRSDGENDVDKFRAGTVPAQEIAHSLGLWCHTFNRPCTSPPYQLYTYPRSNGRIGPTDIGIYNRYPLRLISGSAGVKVVEQFGTLIWFPGGPAPVNALWRDDASTASDFMSYGSSPTLWVSSVTYCQLLLAMTTRNNIAATEAWSGKCTPDTASQAIEKVGLGTPVQGRHLFVSGRFLHDGGAQLVDIDQIVTSSRPPRSGPYRVVLLSEQGGKLREVPFGGATAHPGDPRGSIQTFGIAIPFGDIAEATARVELRQGDKLLAERKLSRVSPKIAIEPFVGREELVQGTRTLRWTASDQEGSALSYSVEYSLDGGSNWLPMAAKLREPSLAIDFDRIGGSDHSLLRVRATNTGRTSEAQVEHPFRVPKKPPLVTIYGPTERVVVNSGTPAIVSGSAVTLENGAIIADSAYQWSSDKDGPLPKGKWIVVNGLSSGDHNLTLSVSSPDDLKSSATVKIRVTPRSKSTRSPTPRSRP
jgi:hypothetical protein